MNNKDYEKKRIEDVNKVLTSSYDKKVIVGGPGTGKTYLFEKIIKKEKEQGKNNFLAITFMGKLGDFLADDLAGLAKTMTMHGFARSIVLDNSPEGWEYSSKMFDIIKEDLKIKGITDFEIGDPNYRRRTEYYKAVGESDVIYYATEILKKDRAKIPKYDLVLIDEFQDFTEIESEFVDLIATRNRIIIVGDDDQSLYEFRGSSPKFIRDKFSKGNVDFDSHVLKFCSRCTNVIIKSFHLIVSHCSLDKGMRIEKDYVCFLPEKRNDNNLNSKILLFKKIPPGMIPTKIKQELSQILEKQKIKSVLIIGEGGSCKHVLPNIAKKLKEMGFKNVRHEGINDKSFVFKLCIIEGYKVLSKNRNNLLAWRLLISDLDEKIKQKIILDGYNNPKKFIESMPPEFMKDQEKNSKTIYKILSSPESTRNGIADSSIEKLKKRIVVSEKKERDVFINQLINENIKLPRPLGNLNITVCTTLKSKGLGADVVFLVGFDQGKFPRKDNPNRSEICQMLVALTRAKKRIYLINMTGEISNFIKYIPNCYKVVS